MARPPSAMVLCAQMGSSDRARSTEKASMRSTKPIFHDTKNYCKPSARSALVLLMAGLLPWVSLRADTGNAFTGTWHVKECHAGQTESYCNQFTLVLLQAGTNICGTHLFSTDAESREDEGYPGSVVGSVVDSTAVIVIQSGRDGDHFLARATINTKRQLRWNLIGKISDTKVGDSALIPSNGILDLSNEEYIAGQTPASLRTSCRWVLANEAPGAPR